MQINADLLERSSTLEFSSNAAVGNSHIGFEKKWAELSEDVASREKQYFDCEHTQ